MAFTVGSIAAKDSAGTAIGGGLLSADVAGGGVGPFFLFNGIVDGIAGLNKAQVSSGHALLVDASATVQPVSGTFWQATQPVSGTVTANAGTNLNTSALALETGGNLATIAGAVSSSKVATKAAAADFADGAIATLGLKADAKSTATDGTAITLMQVAKQISASGQAAAASLAGTLTVGSHAVTNAGSFAVQAVLGAETTKAIGVTRGADGSGNLLTSTGNALDVNIKTGVNANGAAASASSAPNVLATDQATLAFAFDTTQMLNGKAGVSLTPTKVKINVASAATTTLVALVTSKKIRILSLYLVSTGANTINFQSHSTTSNSDGSPGYAANSGLVLPFNPLGWFDTTAGEALDMVTSGSGQVSGQLVYIAL